MSTYDNYEVDDRRYRSDRPERSHRHRERRDDQPRYVETEETYVRSPVALAPDPPYAVRQTTTDVVRRPTREDSDLSVEEVRRDFPPPGAAVYAQQRSIVRDDRYGPPAVRSRSAERGSQYGAVYAGDPRRSYNDLDDRRSRKGSTYIDQEVKKEPRRRSLSRNQKIIAAVGGAALAVGGKELWDRRQADGRPVSRNALQTAAIGAAGAFAGYEGAELYAKHAGGEKEKVKTYVAHRGPNGEIAEGYYSSDEESPKPKKSRRKSIVESALGLAGLGAAAKASGGSRSRRGSDESRDGRGGKSERGRSPEGAAKLQQAAKAALIAGATEAFRVRNEPGGWGGEKGKRILTAAIGAGGIDAAADRDPDRHSKRHILEAVVGGLAANRVVNGSRNNIEEDVDGKSTRGSRSRSRSRSRAPGGGSSGGPLAALATAGLGALAAKKLTDRSSRSRSRGADSRRRRDSRDSYDSRSPSPRGGKDRHKRSKSVTDYARKGLAALGIGEAARDKSRDRGDVEYEEETHVRKSRRNRDRSRGPDDVYGSRGSRYADSSRDIEYVDGRGEPYGDSRYADSRASNVGSRNGGDRGSARAKDGRKNRRIAEGKEGSDSESSLGSSSGDEKRIKKMKAPRH